MQIDMFDTPEPIPDLTLNAHISGDYAPRTGENTRGADVTVAFATDFNTAGERLTARLAGKKYVGIPYGTDAASAAQTLATFMRSCAGTTLNVAGNGIYTLNKKGVTQEAANRWVYEVLKRVAALTPLSQVRSGGQTGIDTAGLVAGLALGIPATGLYPKGFKRRLVTEEDVTSNPHQLEQELRAQAQALHP